MMKNNIFTEKVVQALSEGDRVLIIGRAGLGKTFFAKEILMPILKKAEMHPVYFDCYKGFEVRAFLEAYSRVVFEAFSNDLKKVIKEYSQYLPNIKPSFSQDSIRGVSLSISYRLSGEKLNNYLEEMLDLPAKISENLKVPVIMILDNVECLADSVKESLFTAFKKHEKNGIYYLLLTNEDKILSKSNKNYFQKPLFLPEFTKKEILNYIVKFLNKQHIDYKENIPEIIYEYTGGALREMNCLFKKIEPNGKLDFKKLHTMIEKLLLEREDVYQNYFNFLSFHQKKLIRALAFDTEAQVFKGDFISNNELVSVPSVQTSLKGLYKKRIVSKVKNQYLFNDAFFKLWIRRML